MRISLSAKMGRKVGEGGERFGLHVTTFLAGEWEGLAMPWYTCSEMNGWFSSVEGPTGYSFTILSVFRYLKLA